MAAKILFFSYNAKEMRSFQRGLNDAKIA